MAYRQRKKLAPGGFSMLETIIGLALSAAITVSFISLVLKSQIMSRENLHNFSATVYLREAVEIARELEISNWDEIGKNECLSPEICHPEISGSNWILTSGAETLQDGKYTRSVFWEPVYRSQLAFPNEITDGSGVLDPNTRKVTAKISWNSVEGTKTEDLSVYVYKF